MAADPLALVAVAARRFAVALALIGSRLTGRLSEAALLRAIGAVLVVAGAATVGQALL